MSLFAIEAVNFKIRNFAFFTHWGIYICFTTFALLSVHHLRQVFSPAYRNHPTSQDRSHFALWKWCLFFLETALIFQSLIVIFFWSVLFPLIDKSKLTTFQYVMNFIDHIMPAVFILVDYAMNRVPLSRRHLPLIMGVLGVYGTVNISVSLYRGEPIYKPLDPKKPMCYVIEVGILIGCTLVFLGYELLISWRNRKYEGAY